MFVLRIGTMEGFSQCHINLNHPSSSDKSVVLQYSINDGISWEFIALHSAMDFKQVGYFLMFSLSPFFLSLSFFLSEKKVHFNWRSSYHWPIANFSPVRCMLPIEKIF